MAGERMTDEDFKALAQRIDDDGWDDRDMGRFLAEAARARASEDALRAALYVVSTDVAQDALEDPAGWRARRAQGWVRVHVAALGAVQAAFASSPPSGRDLTPEESDSYLSALYTQCEPVPGPGQLSPEVVQKVRETLSDAIAQCECGGTGTYVPRCSFCDDSTHDHECNDEEQECTRCAPWRAALAALEGKP